MGDLGLSDLRPPVQGVVLTKEAFLMFGHAAWLLARASLAPVIISFALLCKRPVQKFKPFSGHYTNLFYLQTCLFIPEFCHENSSGSAVLITQAKNSSFYVLPFDKTYYSNVLHCFHSQEPHIIKKKLCSGSVGLFLDYSPQSPVGHLFYSHPTS